MIDENISCFIKNKAYFGPYPSEDMIQKLHNHGITHVINLTHPNEIMKKCIVKYTLPSPMTEIYFPIKDQYIPINVQKFCALIIHSANLLSQDKKIYIHCKGGHGRSGLFVASLLAYIYKLNVYDSIDLMKFYHNQRQKIRNVWLKRIPINHIQRHFIIKLFQNIYIINNVFTNFIEQILEELNYDEKLVKNRILETPFIINYLINTGFERITIKNNRINLEKLLSSIRNTKYYQLYKSQF